MKMLKNPKFAQGNGKLAKHKSKKRPPLNGRLGFWLVILALVLVLAFVRYVYSGSSNHHKIAAVPVVLAVARTADVPIYLPALGAVTPKYTVTVRTQINGQLLHVLFTEGQMVKTGDVLAEIDPRPYQAQLIQYQGQLERDQALLENARHDLQRYQKLWRQDSVSKQTLDTQASLVKQDEGAVQLDEGLIESTRLNLVYCRITSPIDGRVGLRLVDPGNYVQTSDAAGLAVIDTLNPITVVFSLAEDNVPKVMKQINAGLTLPVEAYNREQTKLLETGKLLTMDNQVDPSTGTVKLKAEFQNDQNFLFPNQFVNVELWIDTLQDATLVPTTAIQHNADNSFVYILNSDQTVSIKPVMVGVTVTGDTTISSGISPGQSVVVEGADKLSDGAAVTVSNPLEAQGEKNTMDNHQHKRTTA